MNKNKFSGNSRDFYNGFDGLKAHVPICLLRQICQKISKIDPISSCIESDDEKSQSNSPQIQRFYGALIFVDISGFTQLSTKLDVESLKTHINNYFKDMLEIVDSYGGDVVKFAGDAMYVVWHARTYSEREIAVLKAIACAKEIVIKCNNRDLSLSRTISLTRSSFMKMSLTQSLLSGASDLNQENSFDSEHDNADGVITREGRSSLSSSFLPEEFDLESKRSSFNSGTMNTIKNRIRSLSLRTMSPYVISTKNNNEQKERESEQTSLNVHIGISTGVMAGVDVGAEERSEFFLTGQPLLDVAAAEGLSELGDIVVSKSVFKFLIPLDLHTNYERVGGDLECYKMIGPIILSNAENDVKNGAAAELRTELNMLLSLSDKSHKNHSRRVSLLKCLGKHVHQAARMLPRDCFSANLTNSTSNTPSIFPVFFAHNNPLPANNTLAHSSRSSEFSSGDFEEMQSEISKELLLEGTNSIHKSDSNDVCIQPDDSLSAELRELVVLFIKIDVDVTLFHREFSGKSDDSKSNKAFRTDNFGFIERSEEDLTADAALHERLEVCMNILVESFAQRGGQIGQYSCGDKGNVCLGTFGMRGSVCEDNAAAAIECAQTIIVRIQAIKLNASIGVTSGKVYSGLLGSPNRHEYSIMGPAANLAARLMSAAAPGSVLCDDVTKSRDRSHLFHTMPKVNAKGFSEPVTTHQPILSDGAKRRMTLGKNSRYSFDDNKPDSSDSLPKAASETVLYGRSSEMNTIVEFLSTRSSSLEPPGLRIAIITGSCGCGKTTFLAAVKDKMSKDPCLNFTEKGPQFTFSGVSNMFDSTSPFASWKPVLVNLIAAVSRAESPCGSLKSNIFEGRASTTCRPVLSPDRVVNPAKSRCASRRSSFTGRTSQESSPAPSISNQRASTTCRSVLSPDRVGNPTQSKSVSRRSSFTGRTSEENSPAPSTFQSPTSYSHLKAGTTLIIDALPAAALPLLHLVFEVLPSFSKGVSPTVVESTYSGSSKLVKTVEILSVIIQTAVKLLSPLIFITLDDVHLMDSSSWSLLTYMWKHNTNIIILASCSSISRTHFSTKNVKAGVGLLDFEDFNDSQRCKVTALKPLERKAVSQQVSNMLLTSVLDDSQIAIITEATINLAGGNPLFAREITISAVELLKDVITPHLSSSLSRERIAEATLSHVINTLHPHHRIEEIISLRFDRLTPTYQLVLKVASVIGKDGATFTADAISHVIKELSSSSSSGSSRSPKHRHDPTGLNKTTSNASIDVEDILNKILNLNDFIKVIERTSITAYSTSTPMIDHNNNKSVKYKFKNVLIQNSIYDLMLNHQKTWSHQKVAGYLEAKALLRVEQQAAGAFDNDSDSDSDCSSEGTSQGAWSEESRPNSCGSRYERSLASISDWNMLGVHWRLSNNLIKAMACFYESGCLVDAQGDVEGAKFLWGEAYEIFCLMKKEAGLSKHNCPTESIPVDFSRKLSLEASNIPKKDSFASRNEEFNESLILCPECIYHMFKGDSLALEVAVTLMIRLTQNVVMFENNKEEICILTNQALDLVTLTSKESLEKNPATFVHVAKLSPLLFLKDSSLLGFEGKEEISPAVASGEKLFSLRDPLIIFPVLSSLCMRYAGKVLLDDELNSNWSRACSRFVATSKCSKIPLHIIRALANQSFLYWSSGRYSESADVMDEVDQIYDFHSHSEQLIHTYGSDWVLFGYSAATLACIMMGDLKRALKYSRKVKLDLIEVSHVQTKACISTFEFTSYLLMEMYAEANYNFVSYLNAVRDGAEHQMFQHINNYLVEVGKCLAASNSPDTLELLGSASRRCSTSSDFASSVLSDDSMLNKVEFNYDQLLVDSLHLDAVAVNGISILLALRYGKGEEVWKAELCLLEARRLHAISSTLLATLPHKKNQKHSVSKKLKEIIKPFSGMLNTIWNKSETKFPNGIDVDSLSGIKEEMERTLEDAKLYCEAGTRFLNFSLATYSSHDSTVNTLLCLVMKAELLVVLASLSSDSLKTKDSIISNNLILSAKNCLQSALDMTISCDFELPLLLTGLRYVRLGVDVKKGKELLKTYLLGVINRDKAADKVVTDVYTVINTTAEENEWMTDISVLNTIILLLRNV